jgi:hypothetical protein
VRVPFAASERDPWLAQLRKRRVRWLAVGPLSIRWSRRRTERRELDWIAADDRLFTRVHGRNWERETVVYRFNDDVLEPQLGAAKPSSRNSP